MDRSWATWAPTGRRTAPGAWRSATPSPRPAQGKGLGTAAVAALAGCLATVPDIRQVTPVTDAQNTPSRRLPEGQGFQFTGCFRPVRSDTRSALANRLPAYPPQPDRPMAVVVWLAMLRL
jgi:RimJ/RimL family protein N-acetyltransferase